MKYCVKQNNVVIFEGLTKPAAELQCMIYNLMHKQDRYRIVEQTERMEREWDGHYD